MWTDPRSRRLFALVVFVLCPLGTALGQTWDGGSATTNNWSDAANWNPNNVPASNGTATLNFAGSTRLTPVVNVNFDVAGLTFDNGAGAFAIGNSGSATLTLRGGGITNNNASVTQTLNVPVILATSQTWGGVGPLTNSGTLNLGANQLTIDNTGAFTLTGVISGAGSVVKNGLGLLKLNGNNTFSGPVTINQGVIEVGHANGLGTSRQINLSGGDLRLASNIAFTNLGTVNVSAGRQLQLANTTTTLGNTGLVQLAGGSITGAGPVTNNASGQIRGSGSIQVPFTNAGGLVRATGADPLTISVFSGNNTGGGEIRVDDGATMSILSPLNSSGTIVLNGANASLNLVSVANSGTLRGQGRVTGNVANTGVVRAEAGTLTLSGDTNTNTASGSIEAGAGGQVLFTRGLATNSGVIALTGGTFDNNLVALANPGRIEGYGTLRTGGLTNAAAGTISVAGSLDVLGSVNNAGNVNTAGVSTVHFFGPVTGPGTYTGTGTVVYLNTFSPGASPAVVHFGGNLELAAGASLEMELGGTAAGTQFDRLAVGGAATLAGTLDVALIDGFVPALGNRFEIVAATGGVQGRFSATALPALGSGLQWQMEYAASAVALAVVSNLPGDYNGNGTVDAADYTVWRNKLGTAGPLLNDASPAGGVTAEDYDYWKAHFGATIAGGGAGAGDGSRGAASASVPEPMGSALLIGSAIVILLWRRGRAGESAS